MRVKDKGKHLGRDVYGALLELGHLSDALVSNMTVIYANKVKDLLRKKMRAVSTENPFLLSDYPQIESSLFLAPPGKGLADQITTLFQLPRVRNPAALEALLMILPKLPDTQQESIWEDLSVLIGQSSNIKLMLFPENEVIMNQWIACLFQLLKRALRKPGDVGESDEDDSDDNVSSVNRARGGGGVKFAGDVPGGGDDEEVGAEDVDEVVPQIAEQRKQQWFELASDRLGELVALSIWLGPKTQKSILASVFSLSQVNGRDENTRAAVLRAVLSRTITLTKERTYLSNRGNCGWISEAIKEKSPRWEMLLELLFVTAAACVQQTYVSVLASRSVTEAQEKWIRPTQRRSQLVDKAAATFETASGRKIMLSRESIFGHGTLVGESYLTEGVFVPIPIFITMQEDQSAADTYIALQVLELYDMLLWPTSIQETYELLTDGRKTPTGPPGLFSHQPPMLMTLIQLCLVCLTGIHPADPVAFENANRIRKLVSLLLQQPNPKVTKLKGNNSGGTVSEWLILTVVHIHATLRRVRQFIFSTVTKPATPEKLIELKQAACAAEQLMRVLALIVSANDETLKQTFSTGPGDAQFSEVMLTSHVDSGRKASAATKDEGVRKAMSWLDSAWLVSQVASIPAVYNVVKKVGNEEMSFAESLSHSIEPPPQFDWDNNYGPEVEAEKRSNLGKKKLMKAEIRGRKLWKRQRAMMHRSQAASWAHMLTMSRRAAWSPWMETVGERGSVRNDGKMPAAVWKLSNHRDGFGRRMLLQRNFTYGHHDDSSYNNHKHTKSSVEATLPTEATSSLLKKVGRLTMAPQDGDLRRLEEDDTDDDEDENGDEDYDSDGASVIAANKKANTKSPLRNQPPKTIVKELKLGVQLVVLGVTVPGTLVLTEFHAVFAHDPVQLEVLKKKKSQGTIPPYLIAAPLTWRLDKLVEIHNRRFDLEPCAVELYFADGQDVFIAFDGKMDARRKFWKGIQQRVATGAAGLLRHVPKSRKPHKVLAEAKLTDAWRTRRITNFEYLLRLNVIAGRSFNDLSQYPVFPWIIADYTSDNLDLDDVDNSQGQFRDLTKPIGAINPTRLASFVERYRDLADDDPAEAYMYGTHYSSAGIVLHFLLRQEPFTSLAIDFQGGHFDCPDRLFFNVAESWKGCTSSTSDVKEVIPEWYCFPEALLNRNNWDLGELQVGPDVSDVILPPWAKGDSKTQRTFEFVRLNRKALESEYVSMNLHHWIDLIFGENQRSFEKFNVFYPLTYENAVDLEAEEDSVQREAHVAQIRHFGQTPSQIVKKAHPKRLPVNECMRPLCSSPDMIENMKFWSIPKHARPSDSKPHGSVQALIIVGDRLVSMYGDLTVNIVRWSNMPDGSGLPFTLTNRSTKVLPEKATAKSPYTLTSDMRRPSTPNPTRIRAQTNPIFGSFGICTSTGPNASAGTGGDSRLLSCGYWDGALKCHALESSTLRLQASTSGGHCGEVTVLQVGGDGQTVVTGGADATCRVWIVDNAGMASALTAEDPLDTNPYIDSTNHANATEQQGGMSAAANDLGLLSSQEENEGKTREVSEDKVEGEGDDTQLEGGVERLLRCVHILWGHEAPITALALSTTLDLVVSGAENGHLVLHRVQAGDHVRNIVDATNKVGDYGPISMIAISDPLCYIVVHCRESLSLRVFSINGDFLCETKTTQALNAMVVSNVGDLLIVGGDNGVLEIYSIHNLELLRTKSFQSSKSKKSSSGGAEDTSPSAITALTFGKDYQYLFIGTEAGEVWICTDPRIRLEMLDIAINRTFAGMI
jgi:WD40 repeat protein